MINTLVATVGQTLVIKGYAQDFDAAIEAMQFSCDNGNTWTSYQTPNADPDRNVNWSFSFTPPHAGHYQLLARAVGKKGKVTPEPARIKIEARTTN